MVVVMRGASLCSMGLFVNAVTWKASIPLASRRMECCADDGGCACPQLQPVQFTVSRAYVTDLPTNTIDRERAAIFVAEFLAWWAQAGRVYYGPDSGRGNRDDGLRNFAADAIDIAGGLELARHIASDLTAADMNTDD